MKTERPRRAIGIVRVSVVKGREDISSPSDQRDAIHALADREGWQLVDVLEELDVSGNALLADRPKLSQAVTAAQTGTADVIASATTERLWWNAEVREQVLRLVQGAGGEVWSADEGRLSNGTAAEEFSGSVRLQADRFSRRQNAEKSSLAVKRAIARGVVPWASVYPGYLREKGKPYTVDPVKAPVVATAFQMRADGATIEAVHTYLAANGIVLVYSGVGKLLASRIPLGEIHFGQYTPNLNAHPVIVDRETWGRVQRVKVPRGRKAKSERLLARLGVLRCGSCGARMVVGTSNNSGYYLYRCPPTGDCNRRVTISAELVEGIVVESVRAALADAEGRASAESHAREAEDALAGAQAVLDGAIRMFSGLDLDDETAAQERLAELRVVRDKARERVDHLGSPRAVVTINAARDWERLSVEARRALIRATVDRVLVAPGRGADRVTVELFGE